MFYRFACFVVRAFYRGVWGLQVEGVEHIPPSGGFLLAANHTSYLDPPALGVTCPRRLRFMAKKDLFHNPLFGFLLRDLGSFPVERGESDRRALRTALDSLASGLGVVVFPEGRRSLDGTLLPGEPGVALLAARAQVPVVPAGIVGTRGVLEGRRFRPGSARIRVRFGPPLYPRPEDARARRERLQEFTDEIMAAIAALLPPEKAASGSSLGQGSDSHST